LNILPNEIMKKISLTFLLLLAVNSVGGAEPNDAAKATVAKNDAETDRTAALRGSFGTYDGVPRGPDGRVDQQRLLRELTDLKVNTYHWLIYNKDTDWDDLQKFLPLAREKKILVWACLVPPSESPPRTQHYSEPFRLDYERWAVEFARLSLREPYLVAWTIDDFTHNLEFFTPERLGQILAESRKINPRLAFVPCTYFPKIDERFTKDYRGLYDGLLFPYRADSAKGNLTDPTLVEKEVAAIRKTVGPAIPIIVDVYATKHSTLGVSTPPYVEEVMNRGIRSGDGVHVFRHLDSRIDPEKDAIVRKLFHAWAADPQLPKPRLADQKDLDAK
jgi:hypothetical protein